MIFLVVSKRIILLSDDILIDLSLLYLASKEGLTGLDLTEGKSGLVFMPVRPCLPADYQVVSCCDFGFFELTLDQECQCCVTDTTVISSWPEYT